MAANVAPAPQKPAGLTPAQLYVLSKQDEDRRLLTLLLMQQCGSCKPCGRRQADRKTMTRKGSYRKGGYRKGGYRKGSYRKGSNRKTMTRKTMTRKGSYRKGSCRKTMARKTKKRCKQRCTKKLKNGKRCLHCAKPGKKRCGHH